MNMLGFLPDTERGENRSRVYLQSEESEKTSSLDQAIKYLRDEVNTPIIFRDITPGPNMTVKFLLNVRPRIVAGCELSSDDQNKGKEEIRRVLGLYSIQLTEIA